MCENTIFGTFVGTWFSENFQHQLLIRFIRVRFWVLLLKCYFCFEKWNLPTSTRLFEPPGPVCNYLGNLSPRMFIQIPLLFGSGEYFLYVTLIINERVLSLFSFDSRILSLIISCDSYSMTRSVKSVTLITINKCSF